MLGYFWTPITAVGCGRDGRVNAQISVSTFGASIVPERPRLLCVLYKANYTHELVDGRGSFTVCVLSRRQLELIPRLGFVSGRDVDKMAGLELDVTERGNPVLAGCLGWAECEVIDRLDLGDATCFLAAVTATGRVAEGEPLWWSALRPTLPEDWLARWEGKIAGDIERSRREMRWLR